MIETIASSAQGIIAAVVLLGACVFFHEIGHYVSAKLAGMLVQEFAVGFGPSLLGVRIGETLYSVRAVPLGGYVRIAGMEPEEQDVERGFHTFPRWQGLSVLVAGSLMNVVLAALAFMLVAAVNGLPVFPDYTVRVSKVLPDSAAQAAGMRAGDEIASIDGIRNSLFLQEVEAGGEADRLGLRPNDLIYQIGSEEVSVPADLLAALAKETGESARAKVAQYDAEGNIDGFNEISLAVPRDMASQEALQVTPSPEMRAGVRTVPLRQIVEHFGGIVRWETVDQRIRATYSGTEVDLGIGDPAARVKGGTRELPAAPYLRQGRAMVSLQFISDLIHVTMACDEETGQIRVVGPPRTPAEAARVVERLLGARLAPLEQTTSVRYISGRPEQPLTLSIRRDGRELAATLTPQAEWARVPTEDEHGRLATVHEKVGRIGVVLIGAREKVAVSQAIVYGVRQSYDAVAMVVFGFSEMIRGKIAPQASGPIGIAAITAERARLGWTAVASLLGLISANLAILNLFPIPPFDGFRIALLTVEGLMGRRVKARNELLITITGVALILAFFLIVTFRDIVNLVMYNTP